ncbi:MAG TPA: PilZ domain-containing protein, partial [Gemmataceae bacterium]|nr:PilZ domain-containing protein [Gemmataceae bacterium]
MVKDAAPQALLPANPAGRERRAAVRIPALLDAACSPLAYPECEIVFTTRIWDLSATGVSFVSARPFDPGTALALALEPAPHCPSATLQARVVRSGRHLKGLWLVGCELAQPLGDEELQ